MRVFSGSPIVAPIKLCITNNILYVAHSTRFGCFDLKDHEINREIYIFKNLRLPPPLPSDTLLAVKKCLYVVDLTLGKGFKLDDKANKWIQVSE